MSDGAVDEGPRLLSGGNPQIPKGYGPDPVRAYISAMPEWKRDVGERLHDLIVQTVPDVDMSVKWNQPFYGDREEGWFMSFRCYTKYVQVQFLAGAELDPVPPKASKHDRVRYLDIHGDEEWDEALLRSWIEQSSRLPGEKMWVARPGRQTARAAVRAGDRSTRSLRAGQEARPAARASQVPRAAWGSPASVDQPI